jgi:AcrR family transcriptional regulator
MAEVRVTTKRSRNRPLDPAKDEVITAAVVEVLARVGYRGFTMDEVAAAAGVGKAAIYRRWPSKSDLLASYIEQGGRDELDLSDTGSLRGDLLALLSSAVVHFNGPAGRANRALLGVVHEDPVLAQAYRCGPLARWSEAFRSVFDRAVARGEIAPASAKCIAAEAGPAMLIARWVLLDDALDEAVVTSVVDEVMLPLLHPQGRHER